LIQGFYFFIPKENAMKTYLRETLLLSTTVLGLAAGQADAAALNFDDGMADTSVAGFYTDLLFTDATFTDNFGLVGSSGSLGIFSSSGAYHWSAANPISIAFANPISAFGIGVVDIGDNGFTVQAYDASNTLLGSTTAFGVGDGDAQYQVLSLSLPQMRKITLFQTGTNLYDSVVLDNLSYAVSAVPEASTWACMVLGLGMLATLGRAKKLPGSQRELNV
jgi:hypothetical protein